MDTLTHGLLGALTSRSLPKHNQVPVHELAWLAFAAAMFPDVDYLLFWIHPLEFLAEWHRAATHSFLMMPVWSVLIGFVAALIMQERWKWRVYSLVCAVAISTHILSDIITIYGTQIFNPVSDYKAIVGTTFFIDGYFTGIVLTGLIGSIIHKRSQSRHHSKFAVLTLCILISYLGLQTWFRSLANDFAHRYAMQNHLVIPVNHSLPQPFSPTHWKVIIESEKIYHVSFINVLPSEWHQDFTYFMIKMLSGNSQTLIAAAHQYLPINNAIWNRIKKIDAEDQQVLVAWNQDEFSAFRKFATFPILYRKDKDATGTCIWFTDLRYVFPVMLPPFRYGMCDDSTNNDQLKNQWSAYRLKRSTINNRQPLKWSFF